MCDIDGNCSGFTYEGEYTQLYRVAAIWQKSPTETDDADKVHFHSFDIYEDAMKRFE
jgi:hypothetical protein